MRRRNRYRLVVNFYTLASTRIVFTAGDRNHSLAAIPRAVPGAFLRLNRHCPIVAAGPDAKKVCSIVSKFAENFFSPGEGDMLAFTDERQHVTLSRAEEIFGKLADNGANFLRIWTCCNDWAMAIEAKKSAWDRSWNRGERMVPVPGGENDSSARKCVKIDNKPVTVSPSHPVALMPNTRYTLTGRFMAVGV